ncbi:hypothetical protein [Sphingobacterium humi]|nr:hypothetical protein [Sphingobacterium humi]
MKLITIEEEAWNRLNERIRAISEHILKQKDRSYIARGRRLDRDR